MFTGQRFDQTGLYFYNARYYDATIGRFISPDSIVPDPLNPQSLNRYSYCLNNPLRYVDPSGHEGEFPGAPPTLSSTDPISMALWSAAMYTWTIAMQQWEVAQATAASEPKPSRPDTLVPASPTPISMADDVLTGDLSSRYIMDNIRYQLTGEDSKLEWRAADPTENYITYDEHVSNLIDQTWISPEERIRVPQQLFVESLVRIPEIISAMASGNMGYQEVTMAVAAAGPAVFGVAFAPEAILAIGILWVGVQIYAAYQK